MTRLPCDVVAYEDRRRAKTTSSSSGTTRKKLKWATRFNVLFNAEDEAAFHARLAAVALRRTVEGDARRRFFADHNTSGGALATISQRREDAIVAKGRRPPPRRRAELTLRLARALAAAGRRRRRRRGAPLLAARRQAGGQAGYAASMAEARADYVAQRAATLEYQMVLQRLPRCGRPLGLAPPAAAAAPERGVVAIPQASSFEETRADLRAGGAICWTARPELLPLLAADVWRVFWLRDALLVDAASPTSRRASTCGPFCACPRGDAALP